MYCLIVQKNQNFKCLNENWLSDIDRDKVSADPKD
jgi:hypothetical protein